MPLRITLGCGKHPQAAEKSARNASLGATTVIAAPMPPRTPAA